LTDIAAHQSHPAILKRLKRAEGHLRHVIGLLEQGAPCLDIATQMLAVERGLTAAKRELIQDHIDHCLGTGDHDLTELRALAKLL
jgi:DNA-binding FrmR family transcriptional regulator